MKRKSGEDLNDSRSRQKIARSAGSGGSRSCDRPWPPKAGMIEAVHMKNFMCHEKFDFIPNQRLNFLVGENGSGKSAILAAITFALGGSAKITNRGSSNKSFIRTGEPSATVEIKLCNVGEKSFKEDLYGRSIIVCRTVTEKSSTYKLKDERGKVVLDRKVREEITRIMDHYNIMIDNPMILLSQDAAKTFLASVDPKSLYSFFHKSTQLKKVEEDYIVSTDQLDESNKRMKMNQDSLPGMIKTSRELRAELRMFKSVVKVERQVDDLTAEFNWAVIRDSEIELNKRKKAQSVQLNKVVQAQEEIDNLKTKDKEMRAAKKKAEAEIQSIVNNTEDESNELSKVQSELKQMERKTAAAQRQLKETENKIKNKTKEKKEIRKAIDDFKAGASREYEMRRTARHEEKTQLQAEIEALNSQTESSNNHLTHLRNNKHTIDEQLSFAKNQYNSVKVKHENVLSELHQLESGEKNKLAAFGGSWMPRLVAEINRNARQFRRKPIGPLGALITIKDGVEKSVVTAIEVELGPLMLAFCCDNHKDQQTLYNMITNLNIKQRPTIITCEFSDQFHDVSNAKVHSKYTCLIDCIETNDAVLYNTIIDHTHLEKKVVINDIDEASRILSRVESVPRNLSQAIVGGSYQYFPAPKYKSFYKEYRPYNMLKTSIEELIQEKKIIANNLNNQMADFEAQLRQNQTEYRKACELITAEERKIQTIRRKKDQKEARIMQIMGDEFADQPPDIAALEDDEADAAHKLESLKEQLEKQTKEVEAVANQEKVVAEKFSEMDEAYKSKVSKIQPIRDELTKFEEGITKNKYSTDHYIQKKKEYQTKADSFNEDIAAKEKRLEEDVSYASKKFGVRVETAKKSADLKQELVTTKNKVSKMKEILKNDEQEIIEKYLDMKRKIKRTKHSVGHLIEMINHLGKVIGARRKNYSGMLRLAGTTVQNNFVLQLEARGFLGVLNFDHKVGTLVIKVNPKDENNAGLDVDRDLKSLSGGERSYTLISFILALWNYLAVPFRILDEFDVFMDEVNRKIAISNIITFAKQDRKNQFIFLTPLNTDNIVLDDDLKIIKLQKLM
eukprot:TRINITY_DN1875_c0_g1_i1.p1 TRINITY_DN1875_c0_g1~~TRINITY_DN1875_c0_g1_i1.p1  ORF type:complete len:1073 (-),score=346.26 TRINITY_DN1875_c0_g1_i1:598-3816(-)